MNRALVIFTDYISTITNNNISHGDATMLKTIFDDNSVQIIGPVDVSKWTSINRFLLFFKKIYSQGIRKIIIYYCGTCYNHNITLTSFPEIKIGYKKFLSHNDLVSILNNYDFDLIVIGYDTGMPDHYNIRFGTFSDVLISSNMVSSHNEKIWSNRGSLYFVCYGDSYIRTLYNIAGQCSGLFTYELCKLLIHNENWDIALQIISLRLSDMNMILYFHNNFEIQQN